MIYVRHILAVLAAIAVFGAVVSGVAADSEKPVVVELFSSQSCSSCPPADALLGRLETDPDLVTITWPVEYWNYLGWKDTLAKRAFTHRQKAYKKALGERFIYTPQVIVNGRRDAVGNKEKKVMEAIEAAQTGDRLVPVSLRQQGDQVTISIGAGDGAADTGIWLIPTRSQKDVAILGGENKGRTITYTNVARDIRKIGDWQGAPQELRISVTEIQSDDSDGCAVLLQEGHSGPILGGAQIVSFSAGE